MSRERLVRAFLWLSVLGWAIGLGAKLYDLLVLASAWSAAPPASFELLPYGRRWPVDPGAFFQPLSAVMAIGVAGAVLAGWRTPWSYRIWLVAPLMAFVIVWIATPTVFWPMIDELWGIRSGKLARTDAQALELARRWLAWDAGRVVVILAGFLAVVRAISLPYPRPPDAEVRPRVA